MQGNQRKRKRYVEKVADVGAAVSFLFIFDVLRQQYWRISYFDVASCRSYMYMTISADGIQIVCEMIFSRLVIQMACELYTYTNIHYARERRAWRAMRHSLAMLRIIDSCCWCDSGCQLDKRLHCEIDPLFLLSCVGGGGLFWTISNDAMHAMRVYVFIFRMRNNDLMQACWEISGILQSH